MSLEKVIRFAYILHRHWLYVQGTSTTDALAISFAITEALIRTKALVEIPGMNTLLQVLIIDRSSSQLTFRSWQSVSKSMSR